MVYDVEIIEKKKMEEYWTIRAISDSGNKKTVIGEKEFDMPPHMSDIASFIKDTGASFASVVCNYRFYDSKCESEE